MDKPFVSINWKETDACVTLNCCDVLSHVDGLCLTLIQCEKCKRMYKIPSQVPVTELNNAS